MESEAKRILEILGFGENKSVRRKVNEYMRLLDIKFPLGMPNHV